MTDSVWSRCLAESSALQYIAMGSLVFATDAGTAAVNVDGMTLHR